MLCKKDLWELGAWVHCFPGLPECGTSTCVEFFPFIMQNWGAVRVAAVPHPPQPLVSERCRNYCGKGSSHSFSLETLRKAEQDRKKYGSLHVKAETLRRYPNW